MIFNNNTTSLGSSQIPMAEGYNGSVGAALALVENARNDYAMFRAMLDVDARELQIRRESAGYVAESEVTALTESAISGIWAKIKELFSKLGAKLKSIAYNFMKRINVLWMDDKKLIKKYEKELMYGNKNLDKLEIKYTKFKKNLSDVSMSNSFDVKSAPSNWKEDKEEREKYYLGFLASDLNDEMENLYINGIPNDTCELKDIGGISTVVAFINGYSKELSSMKTSFDKLIKEAGDNVKKADDNAKSASKKLINASGDKSTEQAAMEITKQVHDMAIAYQSVLLLKTQWLLNAEKEAYKQNKAILMKAITISAKKLEATGVYADAVAEAAAEEVEEVISGALSDEELSRISNASLDVKDSDVCDNPDCLTYGPNSYTSNLSYVRTAGTVDTDINSKSESALFNQLLY